MDKIYFILIIQVYHRYTSTTITYHVIYFINKCDTKHNCRSPRIHYLFFFFFFLKVIDTEIISMDDILKLENAIHRSFYFKNDILYLY